MKNKFMMMVGLPASGKSTYAKKLAIMFNAQIVSSDDIRAELFGNASLQGDNEKVFGIVHSRIFEALKNGENVIYDATNIDYKRRINFLQQVRRFDCTTHCYFIRAPYSECIYYNENRVRQVPIYVMERMYKNIYIPQYYEGWDEIAVYSHENKLYSLTELFDNVLNVSQDNTHHTLTVRDHCIECANNVFTQLRAQGVTNTMQHHLWLAALLHDIGKPFVKSFVNSKGETTTNAHYYQHHLVSAYDSISYLNQDQILPVTNYIQWHMQPYFMEKEKTHEKYKQLWGADFYNNLMILNTADRKAKKRDEFDTLINE